MKMELQPKYQHDGQSVTFENNVRISVKQFNALNKIRGSYTRESVSFLWSALMDLPEGETELRVNFRPATLKRIIAHLRYLEESGFFKIETREYLQGNKQMVELHLTGIHPAILSTMALM